MWPINLFCQNQIDSHIVNIVLKAMAQVLLSWHAYNYYKPWVDYTVTPWTIFDMCTWQSDRFPSTLEGFQGIPLYLKTLLFTFEKKILELEAKQSVQWNNSIGDYFE